MGNVSLKDLEFFVQKRVRTLVLTLEEFDTTSNVTWSPSSHNAFTPSIIILVKRVTTTGQQFLIAQQISFMTSDNMYSLEFFSSYGLEIIYLQSTEEQAVWVCLMLGCKVVVVEEPHFENSVVNTNTHVGNGHTGYYLQPIKIKLIH